MLSNEGLAKATLLHPKQSFGKSYKRVAFVCEASLHTEASLLQKHDTTKLGSNVVQELKINQRRILIDSLEIGIPAPEQMIALGERQLPNGVKVGQLLNSKTLNYKRFTPHRDGLFCERIFGPVQSFVCACGKKKESVQNKNKNKDLMKARSLPPRSFSGVDMPEVIPDGKETVPEAGVPKASPLVKQTTLQTEALFCPKCQVEYISKNVRRHRLGYIKLFAPVTHIWYLKGRPSYLSLFLGKRKKGITSLAYCNAYLVEQVDSNLETDQLSKTYQNEVLVRESYLPKRSSGYRNFVPVTGTSNRQSYTNRFVTTLVGKSNVKIWENFKNSNDLSERDEHRQTLQINTPNIKENLLELLPPKSQIKLKKDNIRYGKQNEVERHGLHKRSLCMCTKTKFWLGTHLVATSSFGPKAIGEDTNRSSVTNLYKNRYVTDQCFPTSNLPLNKLKYRLCTRLDTAKHFAKAALGVTKFEQGKPIFKQNLENTPFFSFEKHKHKISSTPYIRAQSLPFLPSLISPFHLRDCLISFLQSLPCVEDIPIPMYCQTPRRYPLRDVHKFLAELRSTNRINKTERLTNESIVRFLGSSKHTGSAIAPYQKLTNLSSVLLKKENRDIVVHKYPYITLSYKNQVDAFRSGNLENRNRTALILNREESKQGLREQIFAPTLIPENVLVTNKSVRTKWQRQSLGWTCKSGTFARSEVFAYQKLRFWLPAYREENTTKIKQTPFWRAQIQAPTGEHVTLTTNVFSVPEASASGKTVEPPKTKFCKSKSENKRYQQQKKFDPANQSKTLLRHTEAERENILPKLALLPLSLSFVAASSLVRDPFVSPLPLHGNNVSGGLLLDLKRSQDHFLTSERNAVKLSTRVPFLSQESKISLRGVLLNAFLDMIESKLIHLSLPLSSKLLQIGSVKGMPFFNQGQEIVVKSNFTKQEVTRLGFVNGNVSNKLDIDQSSKPNSLEVQRILLSQNRFELSRCDTQLFVQKQSLNGLVSMVRNSKLAQGGGHINVENKSGAFLHHYLQKWRSCVPGSLLLASTSSLLNSKDKRGAEYKYKSKRFTYAYVPTFLYAQKYRYDKKKVSLPEILLWQPTLRYKYPFASTINVPSKASVETRSVNTKFSPIYNVNKAVVTDFCEAKSHFAYKTQLKRNGLFAYRTYDTVQAKSKASLLVPLLHTKQSFGAVQQTFKKEIDTYQARLLHIVFGNVFQTPYLNQLIDSKSSFLHKLLAERVGLEKTCTSLYKTSFLKEQINTNQEKTTGLEQRTTTNNNIFGDKKSLVSNLFLSYQNKLWAQKRQNLVRGKTQSRTNASERVCVYLLTKDQVKQKQVLKASLWQKSKQTEESLTFKNRLDYALLLEGGKRIKAEIPSKWKSDKLKSFKDFTVAKADSQKLKFSKDKQSFVSVKPKSSLKEYQNEVLIHKGTQIRSQQKRTSPSSPGVVPTSFGSETISKWQTNGAKEILLYTGGGALESLLKRFNTSLFCQFLFNEIQTLRKHYKDQILAEHNKSSISRKSKVAPTLSSKSSKSINRDHILTEHNAVTSTSNTVAKRTLKGKERDLGVKDIVTDKNANLFCRRIYRTTRRLKIVQLLMRSKRRPEWMMISVLPVLPPDLRPVLQMGDNLIVASDLNTLYQRVIYRNNRHYKGRFLDFHFVSSIHRLVQDAVDRLIENGKGGSTPFLTPGGRPLKSLSDILKGKRGRFRFNLLGKRVDFSGRSVIVVSPNLKIHECGLPREMALELYKYLLIRQLLLQKRVSSIVNAKRLIKQRKAFIWDILREIIYYHPLLLNRAPTLHRLGIQAFQPKLSLGNAILLHPLVCAGFNADFDGDQMGVHLPLSPQARAEAWDLLWSRNNLLSPATGQPILLPSQDMVLGFYYMTTLLPYGTTNKTSLSYELLDKNKETVKGLKLAPPINTNVLASNNILLEDQRDRVLNQPNAVDLNVVDGIKYAQQFSGKSLVKDSYNYDLLKQQSHPYQNKVLIDNKNKTDLPVVYLFSNQFQVIYAYQKKQIDIHTPIWLKWLGKSENGEKSQIPLELRIDTFGHQTQIYPRHHFKKKMYKDVDTSLSCFYIRTTVGRVLVNNLISKTNS